MSSASVTGSIVVTAISLAGQIACIIHERKRDKRRV